MPGEVFLAEIREQPAALLRLLSHERELAAVAEALAQRAPSIVRLVGHGTSDNAASYGVYAFGLLPGWTALRDSISLTVYYDAAIDFASSAVVALSQSGRTPDVVEYVQRARADGALTIAVTNDPASDLGQVAELVIPLAAGPEHAVAATKTYVNELAALLLLAGGVSGRGQEMADGLRRVAALTDECLPDLELAVAHVAAAFAFVGRMFVIGRGVEFATAREIALKLTETCRVAAEPVTATDLVHGPLAALDPFFPVWAIASPDESLRAVAEAATRARGSGAAVVASGSAAREIAGAAYSLPVPDAGDRLLAPLLSIVPGQLFAAALARAKGLDADRPDGLTKVTLAR
ncbi:MAG TPA: SIS domain-containing protein [Gaiellaceae bacterium]|nr:SIS domain-containing protein [Gaiellaceae bacterium]